MRAPASHGRPFRSSYVDILCIGSGSAALAAAVSAVDRGMTVFVAGAPVQRQVKPEPTDAWPSVLQKRWGATYLDRSTTAYLDELTLGLGRPTGFSSRGDLPINVVRNAQRADGSRRGWIPPFRGTELSRWVRDCLSSPFGMLLSHPYSSMMTELQLRDGGLIRAGVIAKLPEAGSPTTTLHEWLTAMARDRNLGVHDAAPIQRLLVNDGTLVGAVLGTPEGDRHIRARRGVIVGTGRQTNESAPLPTDEGAALCVVSRTASRFARLEVLTGVSVPEMPSCRIA